MTAPGAKRLLAAGLLLAAVAAGGATAAAPGEAAGARTARTVVFLDNAGGLVNGFPRAGTDLLLPAGTSSTLYDLVVDSLGRCLAVGSCDGRLLLTGVDPQGRLLKGLPDPLSATESLSSGTPDIVEGRAIGLSPGGSVWVAATVTSNPASLAWAGSYSKLYLFGETVPPPKIPPGKVLIEARTEHGTGGSVINVAKREILEITVNPAEPGTIRARVLTLRGELITEFSATAVPGVPPAPFIWDGRNRAGETVSSGAYALLVTGGGFNVVRRLVVMRKL